MATRKKTEQSLDQRIDSVIKRSHTLGADIHSVAVACLVHAQEHGDPRKLDRLVKGLHGSNGPEALMAWAKRFGPITWNGDGEVKIIPSTSKLFKPFDIDGADQQPYWLLIEVKKSELTMEKLMKLVAGMAGKVNKAEENGLIAEGESAETMKRFAEVMASAAKSFSVAAQPEPNNANETPTLGVKAA